MRDKGREERERERERASEHTLNTYRDLRELFLSPRHEVFMDNRISSFHFFLNIKEIIEDYGLTNYRK